MNPDPGPDTDLHLDFPFSEDEDFPPPRMDNDRYLEFIESNLRLMRENGTAEKIIAARRQPVDAFFVLD